VQAASSRVAVIRNPSGQSATATATTTRTLEESIAYRAKFLTEYQNQSYANRHLSIVAKVRNAEAKAAPGSSELTEAVAKNLFKLMAYKDE